jgi:hypothetical protein
MKIIIAHSKKYGDREILVDDEDYEYLNQFTWEVAKRRTKFYAQNSTYITDGRKHTYMHRLIMGVTDPKKHIDHRNGNGFDNQKQNLRACTNKQNMCNRASKPNSTSPFLGVSKTKNKSKFLLKDGNTKEYFYEKWVAQIKVNQKQVHLGLFPYTKDGEVLAARAYDEAAKKYHGEFANLNFKEAA